MTLGTTIRTARKGLKLTQDELATNIGIDRTYIVNIEADRKRPSEETLSNILKELKFDQLNELSIKKAKAYKAIVHIDRRLSFMFDLMIQTSNKSSRVFKEYRKAEKAIRNLKYLLE